MKSRRIACLVAAISFAVFAKSTSPAMAWWQFVSRGDNDERIVSRRFKTEEECKKELKSTEENIKKTHPNRYPAVGSCEEYR